MLSFLRAIVVVVVFVGFSEGGIAQSAKETSAEPSVDIASITSGNYAIVGRQFNAIGIPYDTFDYLRSHVLADGSRFVARDILQAGQDAIAQGTTPSDKRTMLNLAALAKMHPEGRELRNIVYPAIRQAVRDNPEIPKLVAAHKDAKTPDEIDRVMAALQIAKEMSIDRAIQRVAGRYLQ